VTTVSKVLLSLNKFSRAIHKKIQGIPRGPSYIYNLVVARFLKSIYTHVASEVKEAIKVGEVLVDVGCGVGSLIKYLEKLMYML